MTTKLKALKKCGLNKQAGFLYTNIISKENITGTKKGTKNCGLKRHMIFLIRWTLKQVALFFVFFLLSLLLLQKKDAMR